MGELIGYARVSTDAQDLTAQRNTLVTLGVVLERVYVDHGLSGTNRDRPGLREAMAACRAGDTLVVAKLDRLVRSVPDARGIADEPTPRQVKLNLGGSVHDPIDPVGRLRGKQPKLSRTQEAHLVGLWQAGGHTSLELAGLFGIARSTVYRATQDQDDLVNTVAQLRGDSLSAAINGDGDPDEPGAEARL